jgi:ribosome-associated protein
VERLIQMIRKACEQPKPRRKTRPSKASRERILAAKRRRSQIKKLRQSISNSD